jgi:hypothetical protein
MQLGAVEIVGELLIPVILLSTTRTRLCFPALCLGVL